jgi:hypothetical protein
LENRPVFGARFAFLGAEISASSEQFASLSKAGTKLREIAMPADGQRRQDLKTNMRP